MFGNILGIIKFIICIAFLIYGIFCFSQSIRGEGNVFAMTNMILVPLLCVIMAAILPSFREFVMGNIKVVLVLLGVLVVCTGVIACFDVSDYIPGVVNSIGLILFGAWSSGIVPEAIINPLIYGLANLIAAFFIPILLIVVAIVAIKSIFW